MASIERFLTKRLKLKVNKAKSAVARPGKRKFLGFGFHEWGAASAAHRAAVAGSIPEPGTGTDAPDPKQQPRADHQGVVRLPHRVARLLRILRDPVGVART